VRVLCCRWATQCGVCVLPKSTRVEGVEENAHACGFELTDGQMRALDGLDTGQPSYWNPEAVETLVAARARPRGAHPAGPPGTDRTMPLSQASQDHFNVYLDKERLQRELHTTKV
jgi:hypothetical protein